MFTPAPQPPTTQPPKKYQGNTTQPTLKNTFKNNTKESTKINDLIQILNKLPLTT